MPENNQDIFNRYFDRFDHLLDWCEQALTKYIAGKEKEIANKQDGKQDEPANTKKDAPTRATSASPLEDMYTVVKDVSTTIRRIQEGRESFFAEWHKFHSRPTETASEIRFEPRDEADRVLRAACECDSGRFAREFFSGHCRLAPSVFHRWMFREYDRRAGLCPPKREGRNLALAAPRGHAKSTIQSLILPLHGVLYGRERYIVILSATLKQSQQRLEAIATQLKTNEALRRVFGEAERMGGRFSAGSVEAFGARIDAYSAGSEFRGVLHKELRPTHIILDDSEDSESVESGEQREKLTAWFNEVVENLGNGYTNLTVVGTLLHPHSLLAGLMKRPDFKTARFRAIRRFAANEALWEQWRAIYTDLRDPDRVKNAQTFHQRHRKEMDEGARALWAEKESYYKLMIQLATRGRRSFFQEKQNDPRLAEAALFDPSRAKHFRLERDALVLESQGPQGIVDGERVAFGDLRIAGFLDSAMGKSGARAGDFAALVTVGVDKHGILYVLDARLERARPSEQARWVFDLFEKWRHERIGVEANCFQELMMSPIEEERKRRREAGQPWQALVDAITQRASKDGRIRSLEAPIENGMLCFARGLNEQFIQQLESYPSRHDDGPDALAGAVELAKGMKGESGKPLRRARQTTQVLARF